MNLPETKYELTGISNKELQKIIVILRIFVNPYRLAIFSFLVSNYDDKTDEYLGITPKELRERFPDQPYRYIKHKIMILQRNSFVYVAKETRKGEFTYVYYPSRRGVMFFQMISEVAKVILRPMNF